MKVVHILSAAALALVAGQADASVFVGYTAAPAAGVSGAAEAARNDFVAALSSYGTDNLESYASGPGLPATLTFSGTLANTAGPMGMGGVEGSRGGLYPTSGDAQLGLYGYARIDFATPVTAFGFYATDVGDFGGRLSVTLSDGRTIGYSPTGSDTPPNGSLTFFGVTTTSAIRTVFINGASRGDNLGVDDLIVGMAAPVPEPATWAMMLIGFAAAGVALRRRSGAREAAFG